MRISLLFPTIFCVFLLGDVHGQVICKDLTLSKGDRNLQVAIVIETTKPKGVPKLVEWAKLIMDKIILEQPKAKFALTSFADYPGKHGSDPEGCYTFHHKLATNPDWIKRKMDKLQATQYDDEMHSSISAGISFTAGDRRIGWYDRDSSYQTILVFTSSKDTQLDNATGTARVWAKGDGWDSCVKNKGCRAEGGEGSLFDLIRTQTKLNSVHVFLAHEYEHTFRSLKRQIRGVMTDRYSWIHACPENPPKLLKSGFDDPSFETDCLQNKKHSNKAVVIILSKYLQEVCEEEFNKIGQYRLKS